MRSMLFLAPLAVVLTLSPLPSQAATAFDRAVIVRPAANRIVPFLIHLPLRDRAGLERVVELQGTPGTQIYHHWLTSKQFRAAYGATLAQVATVVKVLRSSGIAIDRVSSQFIDAHASVASVERNFGADMVAFREPNGKIRLGSRVVPTVPAALKSLDADVEGLVYLGEGRPMHRIARADLRTSTATPENRFGKGGPYYFDDLKQAYKFPKYQVANGTGVRVATVNEADFSDSDLISYLQHERIGANAGDLAPLPSYSHALVPGAPPFDPNDGASAEADLDTQQVAGGAPGATLTGWTTNAFDFPADFLQVYDTINEYGLEDIVSTSYGECELLFTKGYNGGQDFTGILRALHDTFLQGNSEGITYTVSSGDSAGRPCPQLAYFTNAGAGKTYSTVPSVDIPASDPNVVAVGGGNLTTTYDSKNTKDRNSRYLSENAFADPETPSDIYGLGNTVKNLYFGAGGGQSSVWSKPAWQRGKTPGSSRSVPDIGLFVGGCFLNDPGYVQPCAHDDHVVLNFAGVSYIASGTSIAAPETAALLAILEQAAGSGTTPGAGRLGNVNPLLYAAKSSLFHKQIAGYNGVVSFKAGQYWNPSYGLGSLFDDPPLAAAGIPQTFANP